MIKKLFEKEDYVKRVESANERGLTYLPKLYQDFPVGKLRVMDDVDIKGRWSLGWRPK